MRLARHDEEFLVSLNGSPVAMYHQDIVRKAVRADEKQNEFQSLVYEPRRDNIVKKAVVEDTKPKSSWDKFTGETN